MCTWRFTLRTKSVKDKDGGSGQMYDLTLADLDDLALVITGPALTHVLADDEMKANLLQIGLVCSVVVACRVSPKQKALLVALVRNGVKPTSC